MLDDVGRRVPSFGGFYIDRNAGVINVWSIGGKSSDAQAAKQSVTDVLGQSVGDDFDGLEVRVLSAKYQFRQLYEWLVSATREVLAMKDVVYTDIDDVHNRLEIGASTESARSEVRKRTNELGIPLDAVSITSAGPLRAEASTSLQEKIRPLVGGTEMDNEFPMTCTLSFNARRAGQQGFVTAAHSSNVPGINDSGHFYQDDYPGDLVGTEVWEATYFAGGLCPVGEYCRWADTLFASKSSGVTFDQGKIPVTPENSVIWNGVDKYVIHGEGWAFVGDPVAKVGRTTGRTLGTVTAQCRNYHRLEDDEFFVCQSDATYASAEADSGGPVIRSQYALWYWVNLKGVHHSRRDPGTAVFSAMPVIIDPTALGPLDTCWDYSC